MFFLDKKLELQICYFPKTSLHDYEKLCSLDSLGVEMTCDNNYGHEEFQKQLGRRPGGFYKTNLIWKDNHPPLEKKKSSSLGRLSSFIRRKSTHKKQRYDSIIQDQIKEAIVEKVDEVCKQEIPEKESVLFAT